VATLFICDDQFHFSTKVTKFQDHICYKKEVFCKNRHPSLSEETRSILFAIPHHNKKFQQKSPQEEEEVHTSLTSAQIPNLYLLSKSLSPLPTQLPSMIDSLRALLFELCETAPHCDPHPDYLIDEQGPE
jgi:hypothetical protein